jgi:hypothetical protein
MDRATSHTIAAITVIFFICVCALVFSEPAKSHEWYDPWCCNEKDCAPVTKWNYDKATRVWTLTTKHGTVSFRMTDNRPIHKVSQDGAIHMCIGNEGAEHPDFYENAEAKPYARCVYWPAV